MRNNSSEPRNVYLKAIFRRSLMNQIMVLSFIALIFFSFSCYANPKSHGGEEAHEETSSTEDGEGELIPTSLEQSKLQLLINKLASGNDTSNVGGINAVSMIIDKAEELNRGLGKGGILEIGSGYGSAANYIYKLGFKDIQGIEINKDALDYARLHYPHIVFDEVDALKTTKFFKEDTFSLIYMINVYSEIYDPAVLIQKTKNICAKDGIIAIFDYSTTKDLGANTFTFSDGSKINAIKLDELEIFFKIARIEKLAVIDVSEIYQDWYQKLIDDIAAKRSLIIAGNEFTGPELTFVANYYKKMLDLFKEKKISGTLIIAKKL